MDFLSHSADVASRFVKEVGSPTLEVSLKEARLSNQVLPERGGRTKKYLMGFVAGD